MKSPRYLRPLLGLFLVLAVTAAAQARIIWVQSSRVSSDGGAGTPENPYYSLGHAATKAAAGDTIYLKNGVHYPLKTDVLNCYVATSTARLRIQSEPGGWAVLDYSQASPGSGIYINTGCNYITINSVEVKNTANWGIFGEASHTTVEYCVTRNTSASGIHIGSFTAGVAISTGCKINNNTVTLAMLKHRAANGKAIGWTGGWNAGIDGYRLTNSEIKDNKVSFIYGEGILVQRSSNVTISGNEVNDAYSQNYYIDNSQYITVSGNKSYSLYSANQYRNSKPANGIALTDENKGAPANSRHLYVYSNTVSDSAIGLWYWNGGRPDSDNPGLKDTDVHHNTFSSAITALVQIPWAPGHSNSRVRDNTYVANGPSGAVNIANNISQSVPPAP